jgi:peptidoglycan-associated lipoprotein
MHLKQKIMTLLKPSQKIMTLLKPALITVLAISAALAGCGTTSLDKNAAQNASSSTAANSSADPRGISAVDITKGDPLQATTGTLAKRSVYFDFDGFTVKPEYRDMISAHSGYLAGHSGQRIVIQGNTDERGGREYNLALGQKRAEAVRKSLELLGVPPAQMEAVSFGKEKPKAEESSEAGWAENRRADIVYQGQ